MKTIFFKEWSHNISNMFYFNSEFPLFAKKV